MVISENLAEYLIDNYYFRRFNSIKMKKIFLLISLFSSILISAQIKTTENRIEIELKDGYNNERIYEFGENGFVMTSETEKPVNGSYEMRFQRFSTDLALLDEQTYSLPKGYYESYSFVEDDVLFKLIANRMGKYSIIQYNSKTGEIANIDGDFEHSVYIQFLEIANGHAVFISSYKRKLTMTNLDMASGEVVSSPISVEGVSPKRIGAANLQFIDKSACFYLSYSAYVSRKEIKWYLNQYSLNGELLATKTINEEAEKKFTSTTIAALDEKDIIISGTYSNTYNGYSNGLYLTTTNDGEVQEPRFYNFIDLENFLSYLPERTQARIEKKKERMAERGKELEISYRIAIHDIIPCNEDFLFLGEAYYPTYRTETRTTYVNGKPTTTTVQVFDGYQYTHALLAKFNKEGELLWSQCFKMYPMTKPFYVKRFIRIAGQTQSSLKLVFADGKYIYGKEFDFAGNVISEKTSAEINGLLENDKTRAIRSEIYFWYGNYFLSYGFQRIKNTKDDDVKRKRNVLFVNKIKFE